MKEFSAFLYLGRRKNLGSLKSFLWYAPQLSGASVLCFNILTFLRAHQGSGSSLMAPQFSSVAQSCPTLCDPMDCSTPGLPVHHRLPEFTQTHVHRVGNAIQPSHPLSSASPALNLSQHRVFSNESALRIRWPKDWNFSFSISPSNEYLGLISFQIDWFDLFAVQGLSRVFSNTKVQKHQFLSAQLYL